MKTKPCTLGPRHKWTWIKNVSVGSLVHTPRGTHGQFTLKGLYRCQCGHKKHGQANPNGGDLRSIGGSV